jgi:hypothetical protein
MSSAPTSPVGPRSPTNILEKLAGAKEESREKLLEELRARADGLSQHETELARALGWLEGEPNPILLGVGDFASKKLRLLYFSSPDCRTDFADLVAIIVEPAWKALFRAAKERRQSASDDEVNRASQVVLNCIRTSLDADDVRGAAGYVKKFALPLGLAVTAHQAREALELLYARFDPNLKGSWPKDLAKQILGWVCAEVNSESLTGAIESSELSRVAYANLLSSISREPFTPGEPKHTFVCALVRSRRGEMLGALAHQGALDGFDLAKFGVLVTDPLIAPAVRENGRVAPVLREAIDRESRRGSAVSVLAVTAMYPELCEWFTVPAVAKKLLSSKLPIVEEAVRQGAESASRVIRAELNDEVVQLKRSAVAAEESARALAGELEAARELARNWEDRLRQAVNNKSGLREDEVRTAQFDALRAYITLLEDVFRSRSSEDALVSLVEFHRRQLREFSVTTHGSVGDAVQFDPARHQGDGMSKGDNCILASPVYTTAVSGEVVVVRKANVRKA